MLSLTIGGCICIYYKYRSMFPRIFRPSTSSTASRLAQLSSTFTITQTPSIRPFVSTTMATTPDITLYSMATPNGVKVSILLEELGLPYKTVPIDISTNKQKEE